MTEAICWMHNTFWHTDGGIDDDAEHPVTRMVTGCIACEKRCVRDTNSGYEPYDRAIFIRAMLIHLEGATDPQSLLLLQAIKAIEVIEKL